MPRLGVWPFHVERSGRCRGVELNHTLARLANIQILSAVDKTAKRLSSKSCFTHTNMEVQSRDSPSGEPKVLCCRSIVEQDQFRQAYIVRWILEICKSSNHTSDPFSPTTFNETPTAKATRPELNRKLSHHPRVGHVKLGRKRTQSMLHESGKSNRNQIPYCRTQVMQNRKLYVSIWRCIYQLRLLGQTISRLALGVADELYLS